MNLPLTPFIDKWGVFNWVVIYSEACLQKHLLSGRWGLFECTESVLQGLRKGTTKASASQRSVPAEYQGTVGYSICVSTGCCDKLPQTRWHKLCVCSLTVPEVVSLKTSSLGWEQHVVRARDSGGDCFLAISSFQNCVACCPWLTAPPSAETASRLSPASCCFIVNVPFSSSVCVVRPPLASLLEQWGHWALTPTVPISRSLITPGKCILWCNIHKNWDPVTSEALYSLYRLGDNVLSAQCQARLGGWVGIWNLKISLFLHFLTNSYIYKTINMHHKCTLERWNPLYKGTNYQTLHSPDIQLVLILFGSNIS